MINIPGKKSLLLWDLLFPRMYSGERRADGEMIDYAVLMERNGQQRTQAEEDMFPLKKVMGVGGGASGKYELTMTKRHRNPFVYIKTLTFICFTIYSDYSGIR